ncbi:MAG: FAD-dependent oxidoreductase [Deltaproteobacteria bacterium]|nr:FAD-dependent oxidoreductase [Deltaproteobacteria bacterium]
MLFYLGFPKETLPEEGGPTLKLAIIGAGISGLFAARELSGRHEIEIFEAAPQAGGHAYTVEVEEEGRRFPIDMGFIVYNQRNYPYFSRMLSELRVPTTPSTMGFAVYSKLGGFQFSGEGLYGLLGHRRNLVSPRFWRLIRGILRFHRAGRQALEDQDSATLSQPTLAEFCDREGISELTRKNFLAPMAGAIWSMPRRDAMNFPALSLLSFFEQHGLLSVTNQPPWRTVAGGSQSYVNALVRSLDARVHLNAAVVRVQRAPDHVELFVNGETCYFDQVIIATHSDRALSILHQPSRSERDILRAIGYRDSEVVLHCDRRLLPSNPRVWASWNVALDKNPNQGIGVTYLMNKLQPLPSSTPWCVTLNSGQEIDPNLIQHRVSFAHPQLDAAAIRAQQRWQEISGRQRTHYCGAYWRYGFHEDGAWSGRRAALNLSLRQREAA